MCVCVRVSFSKTCTKLSCEHVTQNPVDPTIKKQHNPKVRRWSNYHSLKSEVRLVGFTGVLYSSENTSTEDGFCPQKLHFQWLWATFPNIQDAVKVLFYYDMKNSILTLGVKKNRTFGLNKTFNCNIFKMFLLCLGEKIHYRTKYIHSEKLARWCLIILKIIFNNQYEQKWRK